MLITDLPLNINIKKLITEVDGIKQLYPPQADAVHKGLFENKNLVIAIPTAAGKTLLAELAALKHILEQKGKVIYLSPLRALASEKYHSFQRFKPLGVRVAISSGDYDSKDDYLPNYDIIVSTNEKLDALLRHRAQWIQDQVTLVIIDECHLLNDQHRGPTLEILLARLLIENPNAQILALSATVGNSDEIADWLGAELVESDWRPVPLKEGIYFEEAITFPDNSSREISYHRKDPLVNLVLDSIHADEQVLIFTPSRRTAVSTAEKLGKNVKEFLTSRDLKQLDEISHNILRSISDPLSIKLAEILGNGASFHHAGLNSTQREIVEQAFKDGFLKIICATPTLAAGINIPAKRVIITSVFRYSVEEGSHPIKTLEYKQMVGRAGRPQFDSEGESILIAKRPESIYWLMERYILRDPEDIYSKLAAEPALRRNILGLIASKVVNNIPELLNFFDKTFYGFQFEAILLEGKIRKIIDLLIIWKMISPLNATETLQATPYGIRVSQLYLDPETAASIIDALETVIINPRFKIHSIALLDLLVGTPDMISLSFYKKGWKTVEKGLKKYKNRLIRPVPDYFQDIEYEFRVRDFQTVLFLYDWIREYPVENLVMKYKIGSGDIHRIVETATWIMSAISEIADLKKRYNRQYQKYAKIARSLSERIEYGIKNDAISLTKVKGIGRKRARALLNRGIRDIHKLHETSYSDLIQIPGFGPDLINKIQEQVKFTLEQLEQRSESLDRLSIDSDYIFE